MIIEAYLLGTWYAGLVGAGGIIAIKLVGRWF